MQYVEHSVDEANLLVKETAISLKIVWQKNIKDIFNNMKRSNLKIIKIDEEEKVSVKGTKSMFSKILEENFRPEDRSEG